MKKFLLFLFLVTLLLAQVKVDVIKATRGELNIYSVVYGETKSLLNVPLHPMVKGIVWKIHVKEGQFVNQGQTIISLDNRLLKEEFHRNLSLLSAKEAEYKAEFEKYKVNKKLYKLGIISKLDLLGSQSLFKSLKAQVKSLKAKLTLINEKLRFMEIKSPVSGRIINLPRKGVFLSTSDVAGIVVSNRDIFVEAFLPVENEVKIGSKAILKRANGEKLEGKVLYSIEMGGPSGLKKVVIKPEAKLMGGERLEIKIEQKRIKGIVVPKKAIVLDENNNPVVFKIEDNKAVKVPVEVLADNGIEVALKGPRQGDLIVVKGSYILSDGTKVGIEK